MIEAIIFDWGGVFTKNADLKQFCVEYSEKHNIDFTLFNTRMIELWNAARVSDIDSQFFWSELAKIAGVTPEQLHADLDAFSSFEPALLDYVKQELYGKYKLGMISNQIETWLEPHINTHALRKIFDVIVTSYESKSAKPDKKIFQDALVSLGVPADTCVFIDDLDKNIPTAKALGMQTILFKNLPQLKLEMKNFGILGA